MPAPRKEDNAGAAGVGMRWRVALHLLDALFFCQTARTVEDYADSLAACALLAEIKAVLDAGRQTSAVQATPHLVLLDSTLYTSHLKPLFAKWLLVFFADKGFAGA